MRFGGIFMSKYPYIFVDDDQNSLTYGMFSIRLSESCGIDGFKSLREAQEYLYTLEK